LLVGTPVTATLSVNPSTLVPGNATVTNTLMITAQASLSAPLTLTGQVQTTPVTKSIALAGSLAHLAATHGVDIVDVTDPANPHVLSPSPFAAGLIVPNGTSVVRRLGADKLVIGSTALTNANQFTLLIYSVTDPLNPVLISNTTFPHQFLQDI